MSMANLSPKKLALIIGNSNYNDPRNRLVNSREHTQDLSVLLESIGFSVDVQFDLNKIDMHEHIKNFCKKVKNGDLVLFYFNGHGLQFNNENYLIPVNDEHILEARDIENHGIHVKRAFERFIEKSRSYASIFILDCCRQYVPKNEEISNLTTQKGFHEMKADYGIFIQFACAADQTVDNILQSSRGCLFTEHLLKDITKEDVDIREVFRDIVKNVYLVSNRRQKPLSMDGLPIFRRIYLNEMLIFIPNIPRTAKWESNGYTVGGGRGPGTTLNKLNFPKGIFVNRNEDIFIADSSNHRIIKYDQDETIGQRIFGKNISGFRSDRLSGPTNIIFDKRSRSFIICDYHNRRVLQYCRRRKPRVKTVIENIACFGIAMDNEGSLYVSDTERHEVKKYIEGKTYAIVVAGGNGQGARPNQLNYPTYIFVGSDQSVYISDSMNDRVMKWSKDATQGVVVAGGHGKGSNRSQLNCPTGVVVDRLDTVYVADHWNNRVMRWCAKAKCGDVIAGRLLPGNRANQLNGPEGLAFDRNSSLYIADSGNHRIQIFDIK